MRIVIASILLFVVAWVVLGLYGVGSLITVKAFRHILPPGTYAYKFRDHSGTEFLLPIVPPACWPVKEVITPVLTSSDGGNTWLEQDYTCGPIQPSLIHKIVIKNYQNPARARVWVDGREK